MPAATGTAEPPASIGVVGLGLIGASLLGGLRRALPQARLAGVARAPATAERALGDGLCDVAGTALDLLAGVELAVVCTPVDAMPEVMRRLAEVAPTTLVTDAGSTKAWVCAQGRSILGAGRFCGGHPMAGRESSGYDARDPELFDGCTWVLTPEPGAGLGRFDGWAEAVRRLGARVELLDPVDHDAAVALASHMPFALSAALMRAVAADPSWGVAGALAAGGLRDMVRLAGGDPGMYAAIAATNAGEMSRALDALAAELDRLRRALEQPGEARAYFEAAREARAGWLAGRERAGRPLR